MAYLTTLIFRKFCFRATCFDYNFVFVWGSYGLKKFISFSEAVTAYPSSVTPFWYMRVVLATLLVPFLLFSVGEKFSRINLNPSRFSFLKNSLSVSLGCGLVSKHYAIAAIVETRLNICLRLSLGTVWTNDRNDPWALFNDCSDYAKIISTNKPLGKPNQMLEIKVLLISLPLTPAHSGMNTYLLTTGPRWGWRKVGNEKTSKCVYFHADQ